ncbi:MAG: cytochrome c [Chloroflexi bacterium]|nr:cytochrome c [Chloroflexota bacterium]
MSKRVSYRMLIVLLPLALVLGACGELNTSGEPKIVAEREVPSPRPTTPTAPAAPAGTAEAGDASADATAEAAAPEAGDAPAADAGAQAPDRTLGRQLFVTVCAGCHSGQDGAQGPALFGMADDAAQRVEGLSAEEYIYQSIVDPSAYLVEGYPDIMPKTYDEDFSEHELDSMVAFIMGAEAPPPLNEAEAQAAAEGEGGTGGEGGADVAAPEQETLTVRGQFVQGTADGEPLAGDLPVEMYALDVHGQPIGLYNTVSQDDGSFVFEDVPRAIGNMYFVRTDYAGLPQGAQIPSIRGDEEELEVEVTLYERTTDSGSVAITRAQMLVNYAPINEFGIEVRVDLDLVNTGDRIVTTEEVSENGWPVSTVIELPVEAFGIQPMQTEGSQRYQVQLVEAVPVVKDTWPIRPETVQKITLLYYLPYTDGAVFDQAFNYPVMDATILLPNDHVTFESEQFEAEGEWRYRVLTGGLRVRELEPDEEIDPETDYTLIRAHDLLAPLDEGERMIFTLTGEPSRTVNVMPPTPQAAGSESESNLLPLVLGGLGVAVLMLAGVLWWRQRDQMVRAAQPAAAAEPRPAIRWQAPGRNAGKEDLLRALAELTDAYEAGLVDEAFYVEQRDELKARLIPLMRDDG